MKNRIGWCSITWNPVVGCRNNCEYCYARRINTRFKFVKYWNKPEWKEKSFNKSFPKKPQRIFVGSMSEIYYWNEVWIQKVIDKIKEYPQHTFQFLTRYIEVYDRYDFPKNCWLGLTITRECDREWIEKIVNYCKCYRIPIYLKDSLKEIYTLEIKEFPKEIKGFL